MIVRTRPYADLLEEAEEALVLCEGQLLRISALAAAIIRFAEGEIALSNLSASLEERFGLPPVGSALEATTAAVIHLVSQGVLVADDDASRGVR